MAVFGGPTLDPETLRDMRDKASRAKYGVVTVAADDLLKLIAEVNAHRSAKKER